MTFWRTLHSISEDVAFVFGFSLNMLLLIIIKKVEVRSLKKYNVLLLQCCYIDIFLIVTNFITKPVIVFHQKSIYSLSNGFLRPIGGPIEMIGILSWITSICFCICSMPVSFILRYRVVCLHKEISKVFYITSLFIAFLGSSFFAVIGWKFHYLDNRDKAYLAENKFAWLMADDEGKVKIASVCPAVSIT